MQLTPEPDYHSMNNDESQTKTKSDASSKVSTYRIQF